MTQQQGLEILLQVAELACQRGLFKLQDAAKVAEAVQVFAPTQSAQEQFEKIEKAVENAADAKSNQKPKLKKV